MVRRMRTGSETPKSGNSVHSMVVEDNDTSTANRDNFDSDVNEKKPRGGSLMMRLTCINGTRLCVLMILCLQNSIYTVLRRYSQGILKENYSKVRRCVVSSFIFFSGCLYSFHEHQRLTHKNIVMLLLLLLLSII